MHNPRIPRALLQLGVLLSFFTVVGGAQMDATLRVSPLTAPLGPASPAPRFAAAHSPYGLIEGYSSTGLEAWLYPFQIFKNYRPSFRLSTSSTPIDGATLLTSIEYRPESITRIYTAPGLRIEEKLFLPLNSASGVISYSIQSQTPVAIEARLTPVMGLMWPAEPGRHKVQWNLQTNALVLVDAGHGYRALITSPELIAHNRLSHPVTDSRANDDFVFTLAPNSSGLASIAWSLGSPGATESTLLAGCKSLIAIQSRLRAEAAAHYRAEEAAFLQIETPDPEVNQAIRWSRIALAQAWSCNALLGCGYVAGYGPSRIERRPQYAWFFAGDGMVVAEGLLTAGDVQGVRNEIEFVLKYQDKRNGMIWHELTQSASFVDWANKYPYLYVHVDTTLQFLAFVGQYVQQSGDTAFLRAHWPQIQLAWRYATSLVDTQTGLPRIPADKEGGNEQTHLVDDLGLSTRWIQAADAYAQLSALIGDDPAASIASAASARARRAIAHRYWSEANSYWINGHTASGEIFSEQHSAPASALGLDLFSTAEKEKILNRIASPVFLTAWGIRSVASDSPGYAPTSYAQGSVWPVNSAAWAQAFWNAGRPQIAWQLWRNLVALSFYDSPGHLHEVLQGDQPAPQAQSVPEQSWSSAAFLNATVNGLLGISADALTSRLTFAPHLVEANWQVVTLRNLRLGERRLNFQLTSSANSIALKIENPGSAFELHFAPELPRGAKNLTAFAADSHLTITPENFQQSSAASLSTTAPTGITTLTIHYELAK